MLPVLYGPSLIRKMFDCYPSQIENVWSMVAERLDRHHTLVTTVELLYRVEAAWRKRQDRRGRSLPPRCITARDGRWIVCLEVMNRAATSRTIAQQIQSLTHHSVSTRTNRRRLQHSGMSTRSPLLHLPFTVSNGRLRRQWCVERHTWTTEWDDIV
ncbi:transposable element Tcb1 transposase [Trichonephila clavipes]|nr:transposable element Tcb1 transposase [Trichonephila clavipes]